MKPSCLLKSSRPELIKYRSNGLVRYYKRLQPHTQGLFYYTKKYVIISTSKYLSIVPTQGVLKLSISRLEQIKSKLRTYDEASIFRSIEELGSRNAVGPLVPMPYDPSKPFHQLTTVRCNVSSISNEMLAPLGPAVHRNFAVIPPAWREHQDMLQ